MIFLRWYRFYISVILGACVYFVWFSTWWTWVGTAVLSRAIWMFIERWLHARRIEQSFEKHSYPFKQFTGPYGIRLVNKSESDRSVRITLAEVFTSDLKQLKKAVEQLELMDTLFKAGMQPDGDTWQLHDLKLKYGRHRLEHEK